MFAVIYCPDDKSLVVMGEKSKKLKVIGCFKEKEHVKLTWGKTVYDGTIIRTGDEESLTKFANKANSKVLKTSHRLSHKEIMKLLFEFKLEDAAEIKTKRTMKRMVDVPVPLPTAPEAEPETAETLTEPIEPPCSSDLATQFGQQAEQTQRQTKQRLKFGTSLSSTWSLCTRTPPTPPRQVLQFIRALENQDVQDYFSSFLQFYEDVGYTEPEQDAMWTDGMAYGNVNIIPPSPQRYQTLMTPHMSRLSFQGAQETHTTPHVTQNETHMAPQDTHTSYVTQHETNMTPQETYTSQETHTTPHVTQNETHTAPQDTHTSYLTQHETNMTPHETYTSQDTHTTPHVTQHETHMTPQETYHKAHKTVMSSQETYMAQQSNHPAPFIAVLSPQSCSSMQLSPPFNQTTHMTSEQLQLPFDSSNQNLSQQQQPETQSTPMQNTSNPPPLRRSPRKHPQPGMSSEGPDCDGMVRLLAKSSIRVDSKQLRKAVRIASEASSDRAGFRLASKLVRIMFSLQELSISCGQGMRVRKGDLRPPLDPVRIDVLKEYVTAWCRKNSNGTPRESDINDAITEQVSYARKTARHK